jgi:6,7-dimethyl-8-ribityllumazine synthase
MPKEHRGMLDGKGRCFALVASRFSRVITEQLVHGAVDCLSQHGCSPDDVEVYWVPGAFELPQAARLAAETGRFDAIVGLGCVIRGQTPHFDYVAKETAAGLARAGWETRVPVIFGVITADTAEQAIERAGIKQGGRGWDAALSALEMADLVRSLKSAPARPTRLTRGK